MRTNVGRASFQPNTAAGAQQHIKNAWAGVSLLGYGVDVFVNNPIKPQNLLTAGQTGPAPVTASTFRPREVGLRLPYRY